MKVSSKTLFVLAVGLLCSPLAWSQGNACEEGIGTGAGCPATTPVFMTHDFSSGGWNFAGSDFDGACTNTLGLCPGGTPVMWPLLRYWEFDNFGANNSGDTDQGIPGAHFLVNANLDGFGVGTGSEWASFQTNWNTGATGCTTGAVVNQVIEVSWCDATTNSAWYTVSSVGVDSTASSASYNWNEITGAGPGLDGTSPNMIPIVQIGTVVPITTMTMDGEIELDLSSFTSEWYTENGMDDATRQLVRGVEVLYVHSGAAVMPACETGLGGWTPVNAPGGGALLGPVAPAASVMVNVSIPADLMDDTYFTARMVYTDSGTSCGAADPCLDPQTQGTPTSCYWNPSAPVMWGAGGAVDFASATAGWAGNDIVVDWRALSEDGTMAYEIQRADAAAGPYATVGRVYPRSDMTYTYTDSSVSTRNTYWFKIREVASSGIPSVAGPIKVSPAGAAGGSRSRDRNVGR